MQNSVSLIIWSPIIESFEHQNKSTVENNFVTQPLQEEEDANNEDDDQAGPVRHIRTSILQY